MLKKSLLAATSLAVLFGGAANAGVLKLRLDNVNVYDSDPSDDDLESEDGTLHVDADNFTPDFNGNDGPDNQTSPGNVSVDKPFGSAKACELKDNGAGTLQEFCRVIIAEERFTDEDHPIRGHFEVDVFEVADFTTFTGNLLFDINLLDSPANAVWKEGGNCAAFVRAGSDQLESDAASTLVPFIAGETNALCEVQPELGGNGALAESSIGWVLPIEITGCGDVVVQMTVTRASDFGNRSETFSHRIASCEPSLKVSVDGFGTKVDYFTGFKSFLITEEGGKFDDHIASDTAIIGEVDIDLHHWLVDLKDPNKSAQSIFDATDFASGLAWIMQLQFVKEGGDPLTGIEFVRLIGNDTVEASLDYTNDTATFQLTGAQLVSLFGFDSGRDGEDKGMSDEGVDAFIEIEAFDPGAPKFIEGAPDKNGVALQIPTGAGAIDHQEVNVSVNQFFLAPAKVPGQPFGADEIRFDTGPINRATGFLAEIAKTGMNFGPFDWVGDMTDPNMTRNFFRVSHYPEVDAHGNEIDRIKGQIDVKGSINAACDGSYKFDFPRDDAFGTTVQNGEFVIVSDELSGIIAGDSPDADCADGAFGRADIAMTFYVNQLDMDVDRLMARNGLLSTYGDNSNDSNSIKARSCDDGRFGPHAANKLTADSQDELLGESFIFGSCSFGEVDRTGLDDHDDD